MGIPMNQKKMIQNRTKTEEKVLILVIWHSRILSMHSSTPSISTQQNWHVSLVHSEAIGVATSSSIISETPTRL